ncbi:Cdc25 phosphatase Ibp1 [Diatrype stigma]|uniref:Cdc25 phosphatase Ibp1 n=1 Tax=Diatrype stigma TaxID=117547 RepID=A0AAN9UZC1_9PEZI
MSSQMTSIATLERIDAERLKDLLLAQTQNAAAVEAEGQDQSPSTKSSIAVVDVRDDVFLYKWSMN